MSSRPKGWSMEGAEKMARLRAFKANGGNVYDFMKEQKKEKHLRYKELERKLEEAEERGKIEECKKIALQMNQLRKDEGGIDYEIQQLLFPEERRRLLRKINELLVIAKIADGDIR